AVMRDWRALAKPGMTWLIAKLPRPTIAQRIRSPGSAGCGAASTGIGWPSAVWASARVADSANGVATAAASRRRRVRSVSLADIAGSSPIGSATMHVSAALSPLGRRDPFHHSAGERGPPADAHTGLRQHVARPLVAGLSRGVVSGSVVEHVVRTVARIAHALTPGERAADRGYEASVLFPAEPDRTKIGRWRRAYVVRD